MVARALSQRGRRVVVLEARERIGGRVHTVRDARVRAPIELGAEFVHGDGSLVHSLARQARFPVRTIPDSHWTASEEGLRPEPEFWRAIGRVTPAADVRGVGIEVQADAGLPTCETDANRVEQILVNLLSNAIQHTPKDSTIRVELAVGKGTITYTVRDEGPGIPAEEVERIFDVYATNKEGDLRGTGLGLPLSRRLARLLGGDLHALPHPGKRGKFVLRLPATVH